VVGGKCKTGINPAEAICNPHRRLACRTPHLTAQEKGGGMNPENKSN
jgi:hypothetical protein